MNKLLFSALFALGLAVVGWVGSGFVGSNPLALLMTALIAGVYGVGALELHRYRGATASLATALAAPPQPPTGLDTWLATLHPSLQATVRQRIEGERAALPGPALTPYLVGLLVMLGMLGTFLGMVVTFKGAVFALEGSTDLQAIRSALAAPIKGLGLSFGTSVAGVAASSVLGLLSALSRRERVEAGRQLDRHIAGELRVFSRAHRREAGQAALHCQATALLDSLERRHQQLAEDLSASQAAFHREAQQAYTGLAESVGRSLHESLAASARIAGESLLPVVDAAMREIAAESTRRHERVIEATRTQLDGQSAAFGATVAAVSDTWAAADRQRLQAWSRSLETLADTLRGQWQEAGARTLAQQQAVCDTLERTAAAVSEQTARHASQTVADMARLLEQSGQLARERVAADTRAAQQQGERLEQLATLLRTELGALRDDEAARGQAAVARLGELQSALATQLATLGAALEAPMTRLIHTAAEVPQAAAGVITQLRAELGQITERDTLALQERAAVMAQIHTLLQTIERSAMEQRAAVESLAGAASAVMDQASRQFADTLGAQAGRSEAVAAQVAGSAIELASLGEAFHHGVTLFSASNERLMAGLQRIEATLERAIARSDEQLAYYVEQAREVIDLSISSQQGVLEDLRRLHGRPAAAARQAVDEVAG